MRFLRRRFDTLPFPLRVPFFEYFGISCALLSSSTRSSTVVHSLATSSAKHNLCSNYFKKTCRFYFLPPQSGCGIGCLALLALPGLRYSGSAPLSRLVDPPLRVPFLRSKKPFEVPLSTIQKAFFISPQLFWAPVGIDQLIIYCRYFLIPCKDLYSAPPQRALLNFLINSLSGSSLP